MSIQEVAVGVDSEDLRALRAQLGREPRGAVDVAARCVCGRPLVVVTAPRLPDGSPFPTLYYLTHPAAAAAISGLEARGEMARMNERLAVDADLAAAHARAHADYLTRREALGQVAEIAGVSAGGMPTRVKCLHALAAHSLAVGPGIDPLGDETLTLIEGVWSPTRCVCAPLEEPAPPAPGVAPDTASGPPLVPDVAAGPSDAPDGASGAAPVGGVLP